MQSSRGFLAGVALRTGVVEQAAGGDDHPARAELPQWVGRRGVPAGAVGSVWAGRTGLAGILHHDQVQERALRTPIVRVRPHDLQGRRQVARLEILETGAVSPQSSVLGHGKIRSPMAV